ncbi:hypothetical protein QBC44DRAFT_360620 [Cladorrhinum sp. PSN332]|nr:hypothetical protein QBC44DRAFT_360620 [Cladorrhinum sp. PSN332]
MRLIAGLTAAALSGLAVGASQQSADVYIFSSSNQESSSDNNTPSIPKEVARHILLQRTSRQRYGSDLRDIPDSINTETVISHLARFGKTPEPLFRQYEDDNKPEASQLVVILEGVTPQQDDEIKDALAKSGQQAAFTVSDPPSASANKNLMSLFQHLGVSSPSHQCDISQAINPFDDNCWTGSSSVVKYDLQTSSSTLSTFLTSLPRISSFVSASDLELLLLVLPETSRNSKLSTWSTRADLRRRNFAEAVITDFDTTNQAHSTVVPKIVSSSKKPAKKILPCYQTLAACTNATDSCSGHGKCINKYGKDDAEGIAACFTCRCMATVVSRGDEAEGKGKKTIHWGGNTCQKEDISVQFWLLAGFTIVIIGAVSFAISLLFNVGQEQLPGVIGAGVSRGSK